MQVRPSIGKSRRVSRTSGCACIGALAAADWTSSRWKVMSSVAEVDLDAAELLDQPAQPVRERDAARVDADERDGVEVAFASMISCGDPVKGAVERVCVEQFPRSRGSARSISSPFRPHGTGLKDGARDRLAPLEDVIGNVRRIALDRRPRPPVATPASAAPPKMEGPFGNGADIYWVWRAPHRSRS